MYDPDKALEHQCLARINDYLKNHPSIIVEDRNDLATRIAKLVQHNKKKNRLPNLSPEPHTGVPDAYIDDVLDHYFQESPGIEALKAGDIVSWENLLDLLKKRIHSCLRRYNVKTNDLCTLADEIVQSCSFLIWMKLDLFPYDCSLESWVSYFAIYEVLGTCGSAGFRNWQKNISIDQPLHSRMHSNLGILTLEDFLPDERASQDFLMVERLLTIKAGFVYLSDAQCELVLRQLEGQTTPDIAREMGCSTNAVYKLRQRAVDKLRTFIDLGEQVDAQ
jgi:DNA-directed RNA polymerase specialized sigma24 family protein